MAYNFTQYQDATRGGYAARLKSTIPYYAPLNQSNFTDKFSRSAIPSSTPHAPRNLINQHGYPIPQKRQIRHRRLLDTNVFKSASAPNLLLDKDEQRGDAATAVAAVGKYTTDQKQQTSSQLVIAEAWTTENIVNKKTTGIKVKPYRRSTGRKAPAGVPLLDLHKLNEPDSQMKPVELLSVTPDSSHSDISWGPVRIPDEGDRDHITTVEDAEEDIQHSGDRQNNEEPVVLSVRDSDRVSSVKETSTSSVQDHDGIIETPVAAFDNIVMEKIAQQMEDDQMCPCVATPPDPPKPYTQAGDQRKRTAHQHLQPTSLHYYTGISKDNTGSLNKRMKFSVRLLSRNGRDIHREMCGFYFISDNSLTIYELRQFGKKLTAIPLIQRGVYKHLRGVNKGQEYEVNSIRKGVILQFDTTSQSSLPMSLLEQKTVSFKITSVDEESKKQLLLDDIKDLVERRKMEVYLSQPLPDEGSDGDVLNTIQTMMRERLAGRAAKTLIGFGRQLERSSDKNGVTLLQLQLALRQFHISITPEDLQRFWSLVDPNSRGSVDHVTCLRGLVGEMKEGRKHLVHQLFRKLDIHKNGSVVMSNLKAYFNPRIHPEVVAGRKSCDEVSFIVFGALEVSQPGTKSTTNTTQQTISYAEFEDYFEGISIDTQNDRDFTKIVKDCWGL
ncbi:calcyphosin-2-like isoform X2 [Dysidea avara]|uniref:calcyphosin-2-like isoform X2 n=1 Tax=Dysidea avara TaxID=196820 RepID=UPI00332D5CDE